MNKPQISVVMPNYNNAVFLENTISSILKQTFSDFEFIIIDDGSTDSSKNIIEKFSKQDKRIKSILLQENKGASHARNLGNKLAKGKYIAIQDSDDIAYPQRLEEQYKFLELHPKIGVCGTWIEMGNTVYKNSSFSKKIKSEFLFFFSIKHQTLMIRKNLIDSHDIRYEENIRASIDYFMIEKLLFITEFHTIPKPLIIYQQHANQISNTYQTVQIQNAQKAQKKQLLRLGINPSEEDSYFHYRLKRSDEEITLNYLKKINNWLLKLKKANDSKKIYSEPEFTKTIEEIWHQYTAGQTHLGVKFARLYSKSPFSQYKVWGILQRNKFWIKSLLKKT